MLLFFSTHMLQAQQGEDFIGRLTDQDSGEPVVFATIRVVGLSRGVISNADGGFRVPVSLLGPGARLEISSMGYETRVLKITDYTPGRVYEFRLRPGVFYLDEAVVVGGKQTYTARSIVRKAIRAIRRNYPADPFSLIGYYRDYQRDSLGYVNLNEAIMEVYDAGFGRTDSATTRSRLYAYRKNADFRRDSLAGRPYDYRTGRKIIDRAYVPDYGGNEFSILRVHDPVRNAEINSFDFVNSLKQDLLAHHSFRKEASVNLDGETLYRVSFARQRPTYLARGTLYIGQSDFEIYKMEYAVENHAPDAASPLILSLNLEYRKLAGKMYLNYLSFQNSFRVWIPPKFDLLDVAIDMSCRCIAVNFTGKPNPTSAMDPDNYQLHYKGEKLKIADIVLHESSALLFPDLHDLALTEFLMTLRSEIQEARNQKEVKEIMDLELGRITDPEGNVMGRWAHREYEQYREFFTQEVFPRRLPPQTGVYLARYQPMAADLVNPGRYEGAYWMNTPLKTGMRPSEGAFR